MSDLSALAGKVIITCALTGGIHGKEANPNLPEQPDEIVAQGVAAWRAGAAILHVHTRNPDGSNTMAREIYGEVHRRLCAETWGSPAPTSAASMASAACALCSSTARPPAPA